MGRRPAGARQCNSLEVTAGSHSRYTFSSYHITLALEKRARKKCSTKIESQKEKSNSCRWLNIAQQRSMGVNLRVKFVAFWSSKMISYLLVAFTCGWCLYWYLVNSSSNEEKEDSTMVNGEDCHRLYMAPAAAPRGFFVRRASLLKSQVITQRLIDCCASN